MIVKVDAELCIGCGLCVNMAPNVFKMEEDKAVAVSDVLAEDQEGNAKQMVEDCPVNAIVVE
ncbi:MAG: ferredoxin [Candidatus Saelkia tenebricola]|nr:ferredoxin [Candidatus Saelkia tenebricola]